MGLFSPLSQVISCRFRKGQQPNTLEAPGAVRAFTANQGKTFGPFAGLDHKFSRSGFSAPARFKLTGKYCR
jgi:hypothetical protein